MRVKFLMCLCITFLLAVKALAGSTCFKCHPKRSFMGRFVHKPVGSGRCGACHLPHVSKYKGLLRYKPEELCFKCHRTFKIRMTKAAYIHLPVEKRSCFKCHASHTSSQRFLLKESEKRMCISCHSKIVNGYKFYHQPFKRGKCTVCHDPHFGDNVVFVKNSNKTCFSCHSLSKIKVRHNYSILSGKSCVGCHNPHGSNREFLVRNVLHKPFEQKKCRECHGHNKSDYACIRCHKSTENTFYHYHNHMLGKVEGNFCLSCHNPHVGDNKWLLLDVPKRLCQKCHPETYVQKKKSLYVHPEWANCLRCHAGHGSNHPAMLRGDGNTVCVRCHKTQGKFTHPVGSKVLDPRNGQPITCVTCHDTMGTNFKYNLRLNGEAELCIECHKNY